MPDYARSCCFCGISWPWLFDIRQHRKIIIIIIINYLSMVAHSAKLVYKGPCIYNTIKISKELITMNLDMEKEHNIMRYHTCPSLPFIRNEYSQHLSCALALCHTSRRSYHFPSIKDVPTRQSIFQKVHTSTLILRIPPPQLINF